MWVWLLIQLTGGAGAVPAPSDVVTIDATIHTTVNVEAAIHRTVTVEVER